MNDLIIHSGELQASGGIQAMLERFISYANVKEVTVKSYGVCLRCFLDWTRENGIQQPQRADIVVHGICILLAVMDRMDIPEILVSEYGNLDGYIRKYLE